MPDRPKIKRALVDKIGDLPPSDRTLPDIKASIVSDGQDLHHQFFRKEPGDETDTDTTVFRSKQFLPGVTPMRDVRAEALEMHKAERENHLKIMNNARNLRNRPPSKTRHEDEWVEYL